MYCTQCGTKANDGDRYCASCGTPVSRMEGESPPAPNPEKMQQHNCPQIERPQAKTNAALLAVAPSAQVLGRKALKWGLRIVGLFIMMILLLIWREASMKSGMEGGLMGALRGVIVFGTYLAFLEWTKLLDPAASGNGTDKPVSRIVGSELAQFIGGSILVAAITYKIAPNNVNPEGVWWACIILIFSFAVWLWRNKEQAPQPSKAKVTDANSSKRSAFGIALFLVVGFLVFLLIFLILGYARS